MMDLRKSGCLAALLLAATAPCQETTQQPPGTAPAVTARVEYEQLAKEYSTAQREYFAELRKQLEAAKAEGKAQPAIDMTGLAGEWLPKFQAGADKYKGTDGAVPFLVWVANNSRGPDRDTVLTTLLQDHIASPEFAGVIRLISSQVRSAGEPAVREMLGKVIQKNPSPDVQAQALLARANLVLQAQEPAGDEAQKLALADVREASTRAVDATLKAQCQGTLFEAENLTIGKVAPEIAGVDTDGVEFKLSDYRGKVVLLDFWGYW